MAAATAAAPRPPPAAPRPAAVVAVVAEGASPDAAPVRLHAGDVGDGGGPRSASPPAAPGTRDAADAAGGPPASSAHAAAADAAAASPSSSPPPLHIVMDAAALAHACPAWGDALAAAAAARAPGPHLTLRVPGRAVPAALALLRLVNDGRDVPCGGDRAGQILLLDMLRLADAWDVAPVLAAVARALAAAPPDALGWSVAAEAAGVVAGRRLGAALDPLYRAVQFKILHAAATDPAVIPPYLGFDLDYALDDPTLAAAWTSLPLAGAAALLAAPATAAASENSAAAAAALWLARAGGAAPPDAEPALGAALRPEHLSPLFAAAVAHYVPWVAAPPGAPPREARPRRPPSVAACLSFEYDVEAGSVAALVAGGGGGGADGDPLTTPRPLPPAPSPTRFWAGLHWYVAIDTCQADTRQAGLFLHATLPGAGAALRRPLGAAYTIRQASASAAVAPVKLETASVWPATTAYGLAGVRGVPAGEDGGGWVRGGRLRFVVSVNSVL